MINSLGCLDRQYLSSVGMLVTLLCINPKMDFMGILLFLLITALSKAAKCHQPSVYEVFVGFMG